jgi:hypothetical protein
MVLMQSIPQSSTVRIFSSRIPSFWTLSARYSTNGLANRSRKHPLLAVVVVLLIDVVVVELKVAVVVVDEPVIEVAVMLVVVVIETVVVVAVVMAIHTSGQNRFMYRRYGESSAQ